MKIKDVLEYIVKRFPYELACDFDENKIGLTIGSPNFDLTGILCTLDLTLEVAEEAVSKGYNLIFSHHPFIFEPLTKILIDSEKGKVINYMLQNNLSLISMHTNMDCGIDGVDDTLSQMLNLNASQYHANEKNKMLRSGYIEETTLEDFVDTVKKTFCLSGVRVFGMFDKKIRKVGILGGSGAQPDAIIDAVNDNCDCYITGEIKLQNAILAKQNNLALIEVNHGIELFVFDKLQKQLSEKFKVNVEICSFNTDEFIVK